MTANITLTPIMNTTPSSIHLSTKTAFMFFKMTMTPQLKALKTQRSKKVTGQQVNLLSTYLWRNGKVKNIDMIKDIIDEYKLVPLTPLEITQIKKHFRNLLNIKISKLRNQNLTNLSSQQHFTKRVLTLNEMSKLNIRVGQYIKLIDGPIIVGSKVQAPYKYSRHLYKGTVISIDKKNNTCHVDFDDGDIDRKVSINKIHLSVNNDGIVKIMHIDVTKVICQKTSGQTMTLLNDGTIMTKISSFRICFEGDNKSMIDMSPKLSNRMTMSWLNYDSTLDYKIGSYDYRLEWSSNKNSQDIVGQGVQINKESRNKRYVFLLKWKPAKDMFHEFERISIGEMPTEYRNVVRTLLQSYPQSAKNIKIYHLEPHLYGDKLLDVTCKIQEHKKLSNETKVLVHGCSEEAIQKIVVEKTGFQDVGTLNGKVYGPGIYLSSDPVYSARDYCSRGKRGTKMMLLCKTLIGGTKETTRTFKMFGNEKHRTGGSLAQGYEHIYMKPFVYATSDINIAYLIEF